MALSLTASEMYARDGISVYLYGGQAYDSHIIMVVMHMRDHQVFSVKLIS